MSITNVPVSVIVVERVWFFHFYTFQGQCVYCFKSITGVFLCRLIEEIH